MDTELNSFNEPKTKSKKTAIAVIALILLIIAGAIWYFVQKKEQENDQFIPPKLESSKITLQGKMEDKDLYLKFDESYVKNYKNPIWVQQTNTSKHEDIKAKLKGGETNYLYSDKDTTIAEIIENIIPETDNEILITLYNPEKGPLAEKGGYYVYKKGPYQNTIEITDTKKFKVPAYYGIIVFSKIDTEIWGLKDCTKPANSESFAEKMKEFKKTNGWILLAVPKDESFKEFIRKTTNTRVIGISEMENETSFSPTKTKTEEFKINNGYHFAWILFGNSENYPKPDTIVAKWTINEKTGKTTKDEISKVEGKLNVATWAEGIEGGALQFNGKDSYVEITEKTGLAGSEEMSISAWVSTEDIKNGQIVGIGKNGLYLDENNGWRISFKIDNKNFGIEWGEERDPNMKKWYHLVGTYNGSSIDIYVNGKKKKSLPKTGKLTIEDDSIYIGSSEGTSKFFNGKIDDVILFNKALTQQEVQALYESYEVDTEQ